jgi:hypothetical protein
MRPSPYQTSVMFQGIKNLEFDENRCFSSMSIDGVQTLAIRSNHITSGFNVDYGVTAVATSNVSPLSGLSTTVDGVLVSSDGQSVLLAGQTNSVDNGVWIVHAGVWNRPSSFKFALNTNAQGLYVSPALGTSYRGSTWACSNLTKNVIGTDQLFFGRISWDNIPVSVEIGTSSVPESVSILGNHFEQYWGVATPYIVNGPGYLLSFSGYAANVIIANNHFKTRWNFDSVKGAVGSNISAYAVSLGTLYKVQILGNHFDLSAPCTNGANSWTSYGLVCSNNLQDITFSGNQFQRSTAAGGEGTLTQYSRIDDASYPNVQKIYRGGTIWLDYGDRGRLRTITNDGMSYTVTASSDGQNIVLG